MNILMKHEEKSEESYNLEEQREIEMRVGVAITSPVE